jgi:hypothetical protein
MRITVDTNNLTFHHTDITVGGAVEISREDYLTYISAPNDYWFSEDGELIARPVELMIPSPQQGD